MLWSEHEISILRNSVLKGDYFNTTCSLLPHRTIIAIRAKIDKLNLNLEKQIGTVSVEMIYNLLNQINAQRGKEYKVSGSFYVWEKSEGYMVVQYIDNQGGFSIFGSGLTKVACYQILMDIFKINS